MCPPVGLIFPPGAIFFSRVGKEYGKKRTPKGETTIVSPFGIPHPLLIFTGEKPGNVFADNLNKGLVRLLRYGPFTVVGADAHIGPRADTSVRTYGVLISADDDYAAR